MAGSGGCGCSGARREGFTRQASSAKPVTYQMFCYQTPAGQEWCSTSWGAFVTSAQRDGVTEGKMVLRDMLGGKVVGERLMRTLSLHA